MTDTFLIRTQTSLGPAWLGVCWVQIKSVRSKKVSNPSAHISSSMSPPVHVDLRGVLHVQPEPGADRPAPVVRLAGVAAPGVAAHRAQPQGGHLLTRSYSQGNILY